MTSPSKLGAVLLALAFSSPAFAHFSKLAVSDSTPLTVLDDFERPAGTNMGPQWTENHLDHSIAAVDPTNSVAKALSYAEMNFDGSLQGLDFSKNKDWVGVTAISGGSTPQFAGLVLMWADPANSVLVKLQDNNGDSKFDYVFFYQGSSPATSTPWAGMTGGSFAQAITLPQGDPGTEIAMRARVEDDAVNAGMVQIVVQIDANHNGIWGESEDDEFVRGNLDPTGLGTKVGLSGTGGALMDDFGGYFIPEPATLASLVLGGLVAAGRRRRTGRGV